MKHHHKHIALSAISGTILGLWLALLMTHTDTHVSANNYPAPAPIEQYRPITLTFVGDIMMDRGVERSIDKNFLNDFVKFFEPTNTFLSASDITFGNLEGPVTDKGKDSGSRFSFQMNPIILPGLKNAGFDIVSFANNHVGDRGLVGFSDTISRLNENDILFTGAGKNKTEAENPKIITVRGVKIGFLGFTDVGPTWLQANETTAGTLILANPRLETIIKNAKKQTDILVVSIHWGEEYKPANTRQKTFAHKIIDWGADTIIGHHPHVIEETEWYKGKFIAYSLGNFIFDQYFSKETMRGLSVVMTIDKNNKITVEQHVVEMNKKYQPSVIRKPLKTDYITRGKVAAQTCSQPKNATADLALVPVGPDRDIGTYVPKNLIPLNNHLDVRGTATCLTEDTANALIEMFEDMEALKMKPILTSGFRSRGVQESVYKKEVEAQKKKPTLYPSVARPGHSEHQLGTTFDMKSGTTDETSYEKFVSSKEYAWMVEHAHAYGFIQSYTKGTEKITGYIPEPWHWRYVGIEQAQKIHDQQVTTYEFLKNLERTLKEKVGAAL